MKAIATSRNIAQLMRGAFLSGASAAAIFTASAAMAQDAAPADTTSAQAGDAAEPGEILVTGSRIKSPTLTSPSPLQAVTAEDIERTGRVDIQEVLQTNPSFGVPGQSRNTSNYGAVSAGL